MEDFILRKWSEKMCGQRFVPLQYLQGIGQFIVAIELVQIENEIVLDLFHTLTAGHGHLLLTPALVQSQGHGVRSVGSVSNIIAG